MQHPLNELPRRTAAVVVPGGILHDATDRTVRRLIHQGIVPGAEVEVVRTTSGGGRVIGVGRSRIAVDPTVAAGIYVEWDEHDAAQ